MYRDCPDCGEPLGLGAKSCRCGWSVVKKSSAVNQEEAERNAALIAWARQHSLDTGGKSKDLTEQQWYNVCRFWPSVAKRCSRPFASVGPHNPLHATSRLGPVMRRFDPEAQAEREAMQADA